MKLLRDIRGQTMVFGAISLFILVSFVALVANVGEVVASRAEAQNAADAAARSGALTQANLVSTVAFLNDGMAYLYYNSLRYATNVVVFGTLAELKEHPTNPPDSVIGVSDPVGRYDQAYREADEWIPRSQEWMNIIGRMQRAMAVSGEHLVKREIRRSAAAKSPDGRTRVEAMAFFPDFRFRPQRGGYLRLDIDQIEPDRGWHITSNTGYTIEIRRIGEFDWQITSSDGTQITIKRLGENHYRLTSGDRELEIRRPSADHVIAKVTGEDPTHVESRYLPGLGWATHAVSEDSEVSYEPFRDGGFRIIARPGGTVGVRRGPDGRLLQWNDALGRWEPIPGDRDSVTVGGRTIPVRRDNHISLPGRTVLRLPNEIRIGPIRFTIPDSVRVGRTGIQLRSDSVRIRAHVGPARFIVDDAGGQPYLDINGLRTSDADGRWRLLSQRATRHRLRWPDPSRNFWIYEHVRGESYFLEDGIRRLAHHAVHDNDPAISPWSSGEPAWTQWYNPVTGNLVHPNAYHQTRHFNPDDDPDSPTTEIRAYARDMLRRDSGRYVNINVNAFPRPFRLTSDFLTFGINVAVWRDKDTPLLEGGREGALRFHLFDNPPWGYFAISSARAAFLDGPEADRHWTATFDTRSEIQEWVARSYQNLYEPVWTAKLVPVRDAIRSEHIDAIYPDTGTSFLFQGLFARHWGVGRPWTRSTSSGDVVSTDREARWHDPDPPDEWRQFRPPMDEVPARFRNIRDRRGRLLDYLSPDMEDVLDH